MGEKERKKESTNERKESQLLPVVCFTL